MVTLINYANEKFAKQQKYNTISAKIFGGFDKVISYSPANLPREFKEKHSKIFNQPRFGGYAIWKAYLILETLKKMNEGDLLFYCDSGAVFLKSVRPLIKEFNELQQPILGFEIPLIEKQWTKMDAFILMDVNRPKYLNSKQIITTYFFIKKCTESINFFESFYFNNSDERIVTDIPNTQGVSNDSSFIDHRHDQSIFSLLFKKMNYVPLRDISNYGEFPEAYCQNSKRLLAPAIMENKYHGIILSNRRAHPLMFALKYFGKKLIRKLWPSYYKRKFNPFNIKFKIESSTSK